MNMHNNDKSSSGNERLDELRRRMDVITEEMTRLFLERGSIASEIGRVKDSIGRPITDEGRESQLRQRIIRLCARHDEESNTGNDAGDSAATQKTASRFLNFLISESAKRQSAIVKEPTGTRATHLSVFARAKELEQKGRKIIHMEVGEPDFMPAHIVRDALLSAYDTGRTKYGRPRGEPDLLDALASHATGRFLGTGSNYNISSRNIIITPGGRFAVFAAITTLLGPGDEAIIIEPAWPAYRDCAERAGAKVRAIKTTLDEEWTPDISQIRQAVSHNTKMIIINYPNNPTGRVLPADTMNEIINVASEHGVHVLSDEIYADYTDKPWQSAISYGYSRAVAVQSFSKSHAMTGLRIGYAMSTDAGIIDGMASLAALCLTSVSAPIQHAALASINTDTSQNTGIISDRLRKLEHGAQRAGLEFMTPDGGMYIFARLPQHIGMDGAALAQVMLEEYGVAIAPGTGFGPYSEYIRLSAAGADSDSLNEGTDRLTSMMSQHHHN